MKVICRMHKKCFYRDVCSHSKLHEEITNSFANDCNKNGSNTIFVHGQNITCHCDTIMLRKQKLENLKSIKNK